VWFSAGAASAVAAKLILATTNGWEEVIELVYTDPGSEHIDNLRFIKDCEAWFGSKVNMLRSDTYVDTWQVWSETRFLVSAQGARCTAELKKKVRYAFERPDDIQVFGYTAEEGKRADRFRQQNPGVILRTPLIEYGLTKEDCLAMVQNAGIELPAMYKLGYTNNNCIGCVKGGIGYWNKIRRDFPEVFWRMARLEREIGHCILRDEYPGPGRRKRQLWLDELDPERGNHADEPSIDCSILCELAEQVFS